MSYYGYTYTGPDGEWYWSERLPDHESILDVKESSAAEMLFYNRVKNNPTREDWVTEFNQAGGNRTHLEEGSIGTQVSCFSEELIEFNEALSDYVSAPTNDNRQKMIKEWADVQVTLSNFAWFFQFDGEEAFRRVHGSNMTKLIDGQLLKREDGKILKGGSYTAPDMSGL